MDMTQEELQKLLTSFQQEVGHIKEWQIHHKDACKFNGQTNKKSGHMSSLGKKNGKKNGSHPNSVAKAKILGNTIGKEMLKKHATFETRSKGGITSGNNNVKSGSWKITQEKGTIISVKNRVSHKIEKMKSILNTIDKDVFVLNDVKLACERLEIKQPLNYAKRILREKGIVIQIHKGYNQFNPSLYKKVY